MNSSLFLCYVHFAIKPTFHLRHWAFHKCRLAQTTRFSGFHTFGSLLCHPGFLNANLQQPQRNCANLSQFGNAQSSPLRIWENCSIMQQNRSESNIFFPGNCSKWIKVKRSCANHCTPGASMLLISALSFPSRSHLNWPPLKNHQRCEVLPLQSYDAIARAGRLAIINLWPTVFDDSRVVFTTASNHQLISRTIHQRMCWRIILQKIIQALFRHCRFHFRLRFHHV